MNFVDERLEVSWNAFAFGRGASNRRIALASALEDNLKNLVAKARVRVGRSVSHRGYAAAATGVRW
jgi:hypothetical protein